MVRMHTRHIVEVYGERKKLGENEKYYTEIHRVAQELSEERAEVHVFHSKLMEMEGDGICEIIAGTKGYVQKLAKRLRKLGLYREVKVRKETVDLDKMAAERGVSGIRIMDLGQLLDDESN